ncbi:MAG: hypothetical protein JXA18_13530 [Chitinispirillaceae bacterium]|nr:hypothetical protein [Chitinispirillaceae bacterium]
MWGKRSFHRRIDTASIIAKNGTSVDSEGRAGSTVVFSVNDALTNGALPAGVDTLFGYILAGEWAAIEGKLLLWRFRQPQSL